MSASDEFTALLDRLDLEMEHAPAIVKASAFWTELNQRHRERLTAEGLANFKRTAAKDYFTWMRIWPWDSQIRFLIRNIGLAGTVKAVLGTFRPLRHAHIPLAEGLALNFLTQLIWRYAERHTGDTLPRLAEPAFGNPPAIHHGGRLISQDLANSALEYQSFKTVATGVVCELGGGYGRNAFVAASLAPITRYIMVDIPPAIGIAQEYLRAAFPDRNHFELRAFDNFETVRAEFEAADFAFLLPHQLALLPDGHVDLFINISSLHEMTQAQVDYYLGQIFSKVKSGGHFYLKAWTVSNNPAHDFTINAEDYQLDDWQQVFWRDAAVQTRFFEALLRKP